MFLNILDSAGSAAGCYLAAALHRGCSVILGFQFLLMLHKECVAEKSLVYALTLPLVVFSFMCSVTEPVVDRCSSRFLAFLCSAVGQRWLGSEGLSEARPFIQMIHVHPQT